MDYSQLVTTTGIANRKQILQDILKDSMLWKPGGKGYNDAVALRRDYFCGRQSSYLRRELSERYKKTWRDLSPYVVPLFAHLCRQKATLYKVSPRRQITNLVGDVDESATSKMLTLYADGMLDHRLQRAEQISAACGLSFLRLGWDDVDGRVVAFPYWPDKVNVIFDAMAPHELPRAKAVLAEICSDDGIESKTKSYELWVKVNGWWARTVLSDDGENVEPNEHDGQNIFEVLPFVALPYQMPDGCLFEMPSSDDIVCQDAINVARTDQLHTVSRQSFNQLTYSGPEPKGDLVVGVGDVLQAPIGATFQNIAYQPQIEPVTRLLSELVGQHLILNDVSPSSASANPTYAAGVALAVANMPMMETRSARVPAMRDVEQRQLWPIVQSLARSGGINVDGKMAWQPGPINLPQDNEADFRLSQGRVANNVSTWPQEMVRNGWASDIDEAKRIYEANVEFNSERPLLAGIPFIKSNSAEPYRVTPTSVGVDAELIDDGKV